MLLACEMALDLRVPQGRLEEGELLLSGLEHDAYAVRPLARLHLARGEVELAATLLRRHVSQHGDGVLQAPVLALLVEVEVAAARLDHARTVCARLTTIADGARVPVVRAFAEFATGFVGARPGDPLAVVPGGGGGELSRRRSSP